MIKQCYGRRYLKTPECRACTLANWCRDAGDPHPLDKGSNSLLKLAAERVKREDEIPEFTRSDLEKSLRFLSQLNRLELRYLRLVLNNPNFIRAPLAIVAEAMGVHRQSLSFMLRRLGGKHPEVRGLLRLQLGRRYRNGN